MYRAVFCAILLVQISAGYGAPNLQIIGGKETNITNFPFQVSVQYLGIHSCGGTIISNNTVVTSASCIDVVLADLYRIVVGATNLTDATEEIGIQQTIIHENYTGLENDIAIVKLKKELVYSENVQPAKLPQQDEEPKSNETVSVSGYGIESVWSLFNSDVLLYANISIVDREVCRTNYTDRHYEIVDTMVCAGVPNGVYDFCQGDIGDPLSLNGTLLGIASRSQCAEAGYPGIYSKVSAFRNWIKDNTGI